MRPIRGRRAGTYHRAQFEAMEPRLVFSAQPVAELAIDYAPPEQVLEDHLQQQQQVFPTLAEAHDLTGLWQAREDYGFSGMGQTVVIIDSGIAYDHPALGGGFGADYRVVGGFDFTEERDGDPYDDGPYGSHGTHVAGILAGNDPTVPGLAPGVDIVALRVFNDAGQGNFSWVEEALRWVHDNRTTFASPITTVNLSMGTGENLDNPAASAVLEDELAQLEADGIFISVAAGNRFTSYGQPGLSYPAASPYVVPASSVDVTGSLSYFTQRHERAIAAPGRGIRSTVPDYVGNGNGRTDDFARYSGTSMAAPYVAGASVLLREAFQFVGVENVDQDKIHDLMHSTADRIHDTATGAYYNRLNIQRALDAIMPEDDFGSTAAAAHSLGTIVDTEAFRGTIGQLDDRDYFSIVAAQSGTLHFSVETTHAMQPDWQIAGIDPPTPASDGSFSLEVVAGQTVTVGLGSRGTLGHYSVDVLLESAASLPEAVSVEQQEIADQQVTAAGSWFGFTATRDGLFTVEAAFDHGRGDVELEVFDASGQRLAGSYGVGNNERLDIEVTAGQTVYVRAWTSGTGVNPDVDFRVTNLVDFTGNAVEVSGTDGSDVFTFDAIANQLTINGTAYHFDPRVTQSIHFHGRAGTDSATLNGTMTNDTAVVRPGTADFSAGGYRVEVAGTENIAVDGRGGQDVLSLHDSPGDDVFRAASDGVMLSGDGFTASGMGFEIVHAYAQSGGFDVASLYDSPGNDTFVATSVYGKLFGGGELRRAKFFDVVHAYATAGGNDTARLYGSRGADVFVANSSYAKLAGSGYLNRAKFFDVVTAYAGSGRDKAYFYDSAGNDTFTADTQRATLAGAGFSNTARGFDVHAAFASAGGYDVAQLVGSAADDLFSTYSAEARLTGQGFDHRVRGFDELRTDGAGGHDRAELYDSVLDDHFRAQGDLGRLESPIAVTWVTDFDQLRLYATSGGNDTSEIAVIDYLLELLGNWGGS